MVEDYEKKSKEFWNIILNGEKVLTDKEADEIKSVVLSLRKEKGFR